MRRDLQGGDRTFMKKTAGQNKSSEDAILLINEMDRIISGDFTPVDTSIFQNKEYGEKLNSMMSTFQKANNNFVMRLNESMGTIGDNSHIKKMLDKVESQVESINNMENSSQVLENSIVNISSTMADIKNNTHQMLDATQKSVANINDSIHDVSESSEKIAKINNQVRLFQEKIDKISEIVSMVKNVAKKSNLLALNASIESARAGEAGKGFAVVAEQMRQLSTNTSESAENIERYVAQLKDDIEFLAGSMDDTTQKLSDGNKKVETLLEEIMNMNSQMVAVNTAVDSIFQDIDTQSETTKDFSKLVAGIADSYDELSKDCMESGEHYFRAGRYIDACRSDMVRGFTDISQRDWLDIFEMDHFILTWRVYNNVVGFEHLKIKQLNNPDSCKIGKWFAKQTDPKITGSREFKELYDSHRNIHKWACDSWNAKENGDVKAALQYFEKTYDAFMTFKEKIKDCKQMMYNLGYTQETQIIKYRK